MRGKRIWEFHGCLAAFRRSKYWIFIAKVVCFLILLTFLYSTHWDTMARTKNGHEESWNLKLKNKFYIIRPLSLSINCSERDFSLVMAGSLAFALSLCFLWVFISKDTKSYCVRDKKANEKKRIDTFTRKSLVVADISPFFSMKNFHHFSFVFVQLIFCVVFSCHSFLIICQM